jgi:DNA-binding beta-propeller fold protein YncE
MTRSYKVISILIFSAIIGVVCNRGAVLGKKKADKDHPLVRELIPLPGRPMAMALSPDGAHLAVLHSEGLSLVNLSSQSLVATVPAHPNSVLPDLFFASGGSALYFTNQEDRVDRLDLGKVAPEAWISVAAKGAVGRGEITGLALSPSGHSVAVGVRRADRVIVLDLARRVEVLQISGVMLPYGLIFSRDGRELWIGQECQEAQPGNPTSSAHEKGENSCPPGGGFVSVYDLEHQTLKTRIMVDSFSGRLNLSRDGSRLFIAGTDGLTITTINVMTREVAEEISLEPIRKGRISPSLVALSLDLDGKRLYVALTDVPWIAVIGLGSQSSKSLKVESSKVEGLIPVPGKPQALGIDLQGTRLLVALSDPIDWSGALSTPAHGPGAVALIELPTAKQWSSWLASYLKSHS